MYHFVRLISVLILVFGFTGSHAGGKLPPRFIPNKNQWEASIQFAAKVPGGVMFLEQGRFRYVFITGDNHNHENDVDSEHEDHAPLITGHIVHATFSGSNSASVPVGIDESPEYYNYFLGERSTWASKVHGFSGVMYPSYYKGIDLKVYWQNSNLKYDFIVAPYSDPSQIKVSYDGASAINLENGNLRIGTTLGDIVERRPFAFQYINGKKTPVECSFVLKGTTVSFSFPNGYDACEQLIIDPLLIFSTFSGSTADNWGSSATPGENGTLYSTGTTRPELGGSYPSTAGAFQTTVGGTYDVGLLKYDSAGSKLIYASYLGGSQVEFPHSLVMNNQNELLILGSTSSLDFPTSDNAFDRSFNGGVQSALLFGVTYLNGSDIFISRVSSDGATLLSSTFVGGNLNDGVNHFSAGLNKNYGDVFRGDIIVDADDNVYVASVTSSPDFPAMNSFDVAYNGGELDAVLFKFNSNLSTMSWGAFIGGSGSDACHTIEFDNSDNIYVGGGSMSTNFPTTQGAHQRTLLGEADGWIARISPDGSTLMNATFTGTTAFDQVYFLDVDNNDRPYIYGQTNHGNFPRTPGTVSHPGSGQFVQRLTSDLSAVTLSTVFGSGESTPNISPTAFLVNDCNFVYMAGWGGIINQNFGGWNNNTQGMFTTNDAIQRTTSGNDFYFIVMNGEGTKFQYATYLGGAFSATHVDGGTSRFDPRGIVYHAVCAGCGGQSDFLTTEGAWSRENESPNCNNAAFKLDLNTLRANIQTNTTSFKSPGRTIFCLPDSVGFENLSIGGALYEWEFGDGAEVTTLTKERVTHFYSQPGVYTVTLRAIDLGSCTAIDSIKAVIRIYEEQLIFQEDDALCGGESYQLKASGGVSYEWSAPGFESTLANPVVTPSETTTYLFRGVDSNGCVEEGEVELRVVPQITPDFSFARQTDCFKVPLLELTNTSEGIVGSDVVFFDFGDGHQSDFPDASHQYEEPGVYEVKLVTRREFCVWEKVQTIPALTLYASNVFTPDASSGKNDTWKIILGGNDGENGHLPSEFGFTTSVTVYDRWGGKVYENQDYRNDWDGAGLAAGVYYFEAEVSQYTKCQGWLHIMR